MQVLPSSAPDTNASYVIPTKIAALKMTETAIVAMVRRCQKSLMEIPSDIQKRHSGAAASGEVLRKSAKSAWSFSRVRKPGSSRRNHP